jgi:hypothetical protein
MRRAPGTDPARHRLRIAAVLTALLVAYAIAMLPAVADQHTPFDHPHGHALLVGADVTWVDPAPGMPPYVINDYARCVELAGGRPVPLHAHHGRLHFGIAGGALVQGGHLVVPLGIIPGIDTCADIAEIPLPFPEV